MMTKKPDQQENQKSVKPLKAPQRVDQNNGLHDADQSKKNGSPTISSATASTPYPNDRKKAPKTRVVIKYDVGFNNTMYLRGKGANLSWDKGLSLKNNGSDEWIWETEMPFTTGEFKVLINDKCYEIGENHPLTCGACIQYTPKFP